LELLNLVALAFGSLLSTIVTFLALTYYWGVDARSEESYKQCYRICHNPREFPTIYSSDPNNTVITSSESKASKVRALIKTWKMEARREGFTLIPIRDGECADKREIEIIRRSVMHIPGGLLLQSDFLFCLRSYLGYKCALLRTPCITEVREYFKNQFESNTTWAVKIKVLDSPSHYQEIALVKGPEMRNMEGSVLNGVFLPIAACMYSNRIETLQDGTQKVIEVDDAMKTLMAMLHGLYIKKIPLSLVSADTYQDHKLALISDVKGQDRWGYLLFADGPEFDVLKALGILSNQILDSYWDEKNYRCITPSGCGIAEMGCVRGAFVYFSKDPGAFRKPEKEARLKGKQKFRKKESYAESVFESDRNSGAVRTSGHDT